MIITKNIKMAHYLDEYKDLLVDISNIPTEMNQLAAYSRAVKKAERFCSNIFSHFVWNNMSQYVMDEYLCSIEEKLEERTKNILN